MALIYRAFYAFINNPMRTSAGLNTSAMFGFINTVVHIIEKEQPTHIVACLDPSGPTFRHECFAEYKAKRQAVGMHCGLGRGRTAGFNGNQQR